MTPRRLETNSSYSDQPVRFYKFIALTFLLATIALLGVIVFMSAKRATVTIETKPSPVDVTAVLTVSEGEADSDLGISIDTVTVTGTMEFEPTGTREEVGISTGVVTLHNESSQAQPLVATTRLLSEDNILFRLEESVTVPANGTVDAEVYADEEGSSGDIGPTKFTIPGLSAARQKEVYATSEESMAGGVAQVGVVSQGDIDTAQKTLLEKLRMQGENILKDRNSGKGSAFTLVEFSIRENAPLGEEVSSFALSAEVKVLGVSYEERAMQAFAAEKLVNRALTDTEVVEPSKNLPTVTIDDYDLDKKKVDLSVFYDGVAILNANSKQLDKSIFFGKSKDEVRRYVLSLDHVRGVDVSFSPVWILTVPNIAEHVTVVVKEVE